jgi:hypothetical protein
MEQNSYSGRFARCACGGSIKEGQNFCGTCGQPCVFNFQDIACGQCKHVYAFSGEAKLFCQECGTQLNGTIGMETQLLPASGAELGSGTH